jgi:hypothetical protein
MQLLRSRLIVTGIPPKREIKNSERPPGRRVFKQCTLCGKEWSTKGEFLKDEEIHLIGYQWNRKKFRSGEGVAGLLLFTHIISECGTTLGIAARKFKARIAAVE